jgi:uroporphyrinogen decarboxylase
MNHRQRVLAALRHEEPDRVPIDLGSTCDSTIHAVSYQKLREHLGLPPSSTRVVDAYQQGALIEEDMCRALDVDLRPVFDMPKEWRMGRLADGSPAQLPAKFRPKEAADGSRVLLDGAGNVVAKMPKGSNYFDPVYAALASATTVADVDRGLNAIVGYDTPAYLDQSYDERAREAEALREQTDSALVGFFGGHLLQAGQVLRGWEAFLIDLLVNKKLAHAILGRLLEANLARFERYTATVGQHVDIVHFEEDLGMQDRPLMQPSVFREMIKPYMKELFHFVKARSDLFILLHSDGAIAPLIPDLIELGVDAINPVQVSAAGMDTKELKREFGQDIAFWGAGCNSQTVLPFGTTQDVEDEVKRHIDDLASGGGYVFSPIHNIQPDVPLENVVTMFATVMDYGA